MFSLAKNQAGLSLIEVIAAVAIFSIMIAPLAGFLYVSNLRGQNNVIARQALAVAEARMEELRQRNFREFRLEEGDMDVVVEETRGKFTVTTYATYDYDTGLTLLAVIVTYRQTDVTLTTYVSKYRRGG